MKSERIREREYIRGRYDDEDQGDVSSPENPREAKYRFQWESGYDSHDQAQRDEGDEYNEEQEQQRERRERKRQREEEKTHRDFVEGRRRDRCIAGKSCTTSPRKWHHRGRDSYGHRRHRRYGEDEGSPTGDIRERQQRARGEEKQRQRKRQKPHNFSAENRRQRRRDRECEKDCDRERSREATAAAAVPRKYQRTDSTSGASHFCADTLASLASEHQHENESKSLRQKSKDEGEGRKGRRRRKNAALAGLIGSELVEGKPRHRPGARVVSGAYLEEGRSLEMQVRHRGGGGFSMEEQWKNAANRDGNLENGGSQAGWKFWASWSKRKQLFVGGIIAALVLLAVVIPIAVIEARKKGSYAKSSPGSSRSSRPANSNLDGISRDSIPAYARGTVLDPFTWYDTEGFNITFTNETIGGLYIMGLNSTWDDSVRANENVPPLNEAFSYGSQPIRGVNVGGWFEIEPFISPSLFDGYSLDEGVVDEWTLSEKLGSHAAKMIEKHYATFIVESDFAEIKGAGLDHVRIPYSFWAVRIWDGDPYVPKIAWRYLLRAIEWCRKYGLRVKLDLHGVPGSQNGWNHSGHQGRIGWLNGTNGDLNRARSLEIHNQLSTFFAHDRYKNVVTMYGLVNEPLMLELSVEEVLNWNEEASKLIRSNGVNQTIVFHDGFLNLEKWDHMFKDHPDNMYLDTHQYSIFNTGEIVLNHTAKIEIICNSWYSMIQNINKTSTGWGPTICGEWSQADTDCTKYLNNVGRGTRWEGTYDPSSSTEYCPSADAGTCSCNEANADVAGYTDAYKKWLQTYAEAQMSAFETAMGWFYWTWRTESAAQWSYRTAWKNGFMPSIAYSPSFKCGDSIPDFSSLGLPEYY